MATSPRLTLPLLAVGQSQKELTHNEALVLLDMLVQSVCAGAPTNLPPSGPAVGDLHLCGTAPTGAWAGRSNAIAMWSGSGWRFIPAFEGMALRAKTSGLQWQFANGEWREGKILAKELHINDQKVVGPRWQSISDVAGGSNVDAEARSAINQILVALRAHGLIDS
ncbi:DUF2793 domain-containing protein [Sphingomonas sp. LHG3406-1]|uniref:DUF2793 domain-containing protein n=1 Tax=Sphingomonas sp. LHG3406-1 TaxID=2804617 RepID=UPI00261F2CCD|nr:DUF2793 domain-containing protein [Sphingomonas sp. LHG3406-1]